MWSMGILCEFIFIFCVFECRQLVIVCAIHRNKTKCVYTRTYSDLSCGSSGRELQSREQHVLRDFKPQVLPKIGEMSIVVTEVIDPSHFWGQRVGFSELDELNALIHDINAHQSSLQPLLVAPENLVGQCCLAPYSLTGQLYRAKVTSVMMQSSIAAVSEGDWLNFDNVCVGGVVQPPVRMWGREATFKFQRN